MRITTLASGSTGNCTLVQSAGGALLIDAGISARRITQGIGQQGTVPADLSAVLVTHEHTDHISGLAVFLKKTSAPVFAVAPVAAALRRLLPEHAARVHAVDGEGFSVDAFEITSIPTLHDSASSCGWRLETEEGAFGLCTDLGIVTEDVLEGLCGVDCALIEANHDIDMLLRGPYPPYLKKRILSDHGHLSNSAAAALAVTLASNGTERLILGHLSRHNNTPALARETVTTALRESLPPVLWPEVACAPECTPLTVEIGAQVPCML